MRPIDCVLEAFPDAKPSGNNGWFSAKCTGHNDSHASLSFRENERGGIIFKCHAQGCSREAILSGAGLRESEVSPNGYRPHAQIRPKFELIDLAYDKLIPWQFLLNIGVSDEYNYHGHSVVSITYYERNGKEHPKKRVRLGPSGKDSKWDEDTPGKIIPYGLHRLEEARKAGYLLIGEGESDAWTCWLHGLPYLGIPGASNTKCLNGADLTGIAHVYLIQEPDEAGKNFYHDLHHQLRKTGYTARISALIFKEFTGCKDPNEVHKLHKGDHEAFVAAIRLAIQQALPDNDIVEPPFTGSGNAAIDAAIASRDKHALYCLIPQIAQLPVLERKRIRLDIRTVWEKDFPLREFDELVREERFQQEQEKLKTPLIRSARDLMNQQFHPVDWVVESILPPGLIALAGKQKIGKSWLDLHLALGVASGSRVLGSISVKQGDVLYLALEDNERRLQERIALMLAPEREAPEGFEYVTSWPRMNATGIAALEGWIQSKLQTGRYPRLIIIDPWVKVKPRRRALAGETGYDTDYEALEGLKRLTDEYEICILVQFHLRKAGAEDPFDELNASTGVTACADGFLSLKRVRGETIGTLWGTGRDYKDDVDLKLSFSNGRWTALSDAEAVEYTLSKESREVIDILNQAKKPLQPKEVADLLGRDSGTIRKRLFMMKERGEVQDTGKGYIVSNGNAGNAGNTGNGGNASNAS